MTKSSSSPRGEHAPNPGVTWGTALARSEEYIPECTASIRGLCLAEAQGETACATEDGECIHAAPTPSFTPQPNRAARRAIARARRKR